MGGFILKAYFSMKKSVGNWANTLLDNHMSHIQVASEQSSKAITELAGYHREMLGTQEKMITSMERMSEDFREHTRDDERTQGSILLSLRAIEVRQEHILDQTRRRYVSASVTTDAPTFECDQVADCPVTELDSVVPDEPKVG